ncbi:MAG: exported hypothetical protein [Arenicellales bacterium IbO2]|nr:MAG: exported hypothetical protein [Arenicellales bacterium IbO2]
MPAHSRPSVFARLFRRAAARFLFAVFLLGAASQGHAQSAGTPTLSVHSISGSSATLDFDWSAVDFSQLQWTLNGNPRSGSALDRFHRMTVQLQEVGGASWQGESNWVPVGVTVTQNLVGTFSRDNWDLWFIGDAGFSTAVTSTRFSGAVAGKTYKARVHLWDGDGGRNFRSAWVESAPVATQTNRPPGKPPSLSARAVESGKLEITWGLVDARGGTISNYKYRWSNDNDAAWESPGGAAGAALTLIGSERRAILSGLSNGTEYTLQIRATTEHGDGAWSDSATGTPLNLPGAPTNLQLDATVQKEALQVSWTPPTGSAPITTYRYRWSNDNDPEWDSVGGANGVFIPNSGSARSHLISGLRMLDINQRVTYTVQVAAGNSAGFGSWSDSVTGKIASVPGMVSKPSVEQTANAGELRVTWEAPSDNGGAPITGYRYRWSNDRRTNTYESAGGREGVAIPNSASLTSFVIQNLPRGEYQVQIAAENFVGAIFATSSSNRSSWSLSSDSVRVLSAPAAPTNLAATAGEGALTMTWTAPTITGGGDITSYKARWGQSADNPIWINENEADGEDVGDVTTFTIENLRVGQAYDVQVAAVNQYGAGDFAGKVTATPIAQPDDADLRSLALVDASGNAAALSPAFDRATTAYTAGIPNTATGVAFTAVYFGAGLVIDGDSGNAPASGARGNFVSLALGESKAINLVVSARDGSTTKTYTVTVTRAASAPNKMSPPTLLTPDSPSILRIEWGWDGSGDNGARHNAFAIQYRVKGTTNWTNDAPGNAAVRFWAKTVSPAGAVFQARMRVRNSIGWGAWSEIAEGRASGPPDAPSASAQARNGGLLAQWTPAGFTGGIGLASFDVRWRTSSPVGNWQPSANGESVAGAATREYAITGLNGGAQYDVQVRARNMFSGSQISAWSASAQATPTSATLTITPLAATKTYGAADPALDYNVTGLADGEGKSDVFSAAPFERAAGENVGEYAFRLKDPLPFATTGNPAGKYTVASALGGSAKFTITKKEVTFASTVADKTYDGNANAPANLGGGFTAGVVTATVNGVSIDDTDAAKLAVRGGRFTDKNVGTAKTVTGFRLAGSSAGNYSLASSSAVSGDINQLATTLTLSAASRVYDGTAATGDVAAEFNPQILSGDTVTVDRSGAAYADANAGAAKAIGGVTTGGADAGNYDITIAGSGEITRRPLRVTASGSGILAPTATALGDRSLLSIGSGVSGEGIVSPDTAASVLSGSIALGARTPASGDGQAPLTVGGLTATGNYQLIFTDGVWVFTGKPTLEITPTDASRAFGASDPASFGYTVAPAGGSAFDGSDTASSQFFTASPVRRAPGADAGEYAFSLAASPAYGSNSAGNNYQAIYNFVIKAGAAYRITPKELTAAAVTLRKVYDGNTGVRDATIAGGALSGLVGSDSLQLQIASASDGAYASADAGTGIAVSDMDGSDFVLAAAGGNAAKPANYSLATSVSVSGEITAKEVTVADTTLTRDYDGTTAFGASSVKAGSGAVQTGVSGESFTLRATAGSYDSADAGAGKSVSGAEFALVAANVASKPANYSVPAGIAVNGEITAKEVTVGAVTLTKTYDNDDTTAGAVISGGAVGGAAAGESFTLALASDNDGTYDSVDAASGIGVSGADFALAGADAGSKPANYQLPTSISVSGVIAPKTVAVADVVLRKTYDGANTVNANAAVITGGAISDTVGTHTFTLSVAGGNAIRYAQADAGNSLTLTYMVSRDFALRAAGAGDPENYALPDDLAATGEITPREVTVSADVVLTKTYDGTLVVQNVRLSGGTVGNAAQGESLTLQVTPNRGGFSQRDVGGGLTVPGAQFTLQAGAATKAENYALPAGITAAGAIEPKTVTISPAPKLSKEYDGGPSFGGTALVARSGEVGGEVGADALALVATSGVYASANVGAGIEISNVVWELQTAPGGEGDPANYQLPSSLPVTLSDGEIRRKRLTITAGDTKPTKVYDGTDAPPPALTAALKIEGLLAADEGGGSIRFDSSTYNSKNVLEATVLTVAVSGSAAGNYEVVAGGIAAEITPKEVAVTITATGPKTKVYDGATAPPPGLTVTGALTESDIFENDRGKVAFAGAGVYNSKNVDEADSISVAFSGEEAGNYAAGESVGGATITPRTLRLTADSVTALTRPDAADLTFRIGADVDGEGLAPGDDGGDVLSGELAYGASALPSGGIPILQGTLAANANYTVVFADGVYFDSGRLDVDFSGGADGTDGALIARYLFGLRGAALSEGLSPAGGLAGAGLEARLQALLDDDVFDVDGNAGTTGRDGIIIARYLLGVTEAASLVKGQAAASGADAVKTTLESLVP